MMPAKSGVGKSRRESINQSLNEKASKVAETAGESEAGSAKHLIDSGHLEKEFDKFRSEIVTLFKEFDQKIDKKLDSIDKKFSEAFDNLKKEMGSLKVEVQETKTDISNLKVKSRELEASVTYMVEEIEEEKSKVSDRFDKFKSKLEEMNVSLLQKEKHDRHYNLLFYGFEETPGENLELLMKTFLKDKLKIDEAKVKAMNFANYHRLPGDPTKGPKPIIVKFLSIPDRELVFSKSFSPVLRDEKKRILSDLPVVMKRERGRLAQAAYDIRKNEQLKTRIVEKGLTVTLEVRKDTTEEWKKRYV